MPAANARYRIIGVEHAAILKAANTANEVQSVSISGAPTGGTFTLTFGGQTTAGIAYNATAAQVQSALEALSSIGSGNVSCSGGALPGSAVSVTFQGTLGNTDHPLMTANSAGLTGGTSPTVTVTQTTAGSGSIVEHDLHFINQVSFDVQERDVTFEGDGQEVRKYFISSMTANLKTDTYDLEGISLAFGKNEVTTGLPASVTGRTYFGESAEVAGVRGGLVAEVLAENLETNLNERLRVIAPLGTLTALKPPALQHNQKAGLELKFSAERTTKDVLGLALPSVPTGGCFWYLDRKNA